MLVDADNEELDVLHRELVGPKSPIASEFREVENIVALFLPKRNIETWIRFLEGSPVDESTPYPKEHKGRERKCAEAARTLVRHCQSEKFPSPPPSSLTRACDEFDRVLRT
ncbi:MAG: hypothetical protein IT350_03365 [Deltaproteobacteria bacterium]|nr:hypothetical protein [Deltaproteobacteria bacterium]